MCPVVTCPHFMITSPDFLLYSWPSWVIILISIRQLYLTSMMNSELAPPTWNPSACHAILPSTHGHDTKTALHIRLVTLWIGVIPAPTPQTTLWFSTLFVVVTRLFTKRSANPPCCHGIKKKCLRTLSTVWSYHHSQVLLYMRLSSWLVKLTVSHQCLDFHSLALASDQLTSWVRVNMLIMTGW